MNTHILTQINNILFSVKLFEDSLELAAMKDDGIISKEEEKIIRKAKKASEEYKKELEKIKNGL